MQNGSFLFPIFLRLVRTLQFQATRVHSNGVLANFCAFKRHFEIIVAQRFYAVLHGLTIVQNKRVDVGQPRVAAQN